MHLKGPEGPEPEAKGLLNCRVNGARTWSGGELEGDAAGLVGASLGLAVSLLCFGNATSAFGSPQFKMVPPTAPKSTLTPSQTRVTWKRAHRGRHVQIDLTLVSFTFKNPL